MAECGVPLNSLDGSAWSCPGLPDLSDSFWPYRSAATLSFENMDVPDAHDATSEYSGPRPPWGGVWSQDCAPHDFPEETQILVLQPFCALAPIRTQACTTLFILARTLALSRPHVGTEHTCVGRQKSRQHL